MPHTLVIVESPTKAKKIGQYLGSEYTVKASVGHIRDLPLRSLGVNMDSLTPDYEVSEDKKQTVAGLRKLVKTHSQVMLATDLDREGEAIAWHLKATLNLKDGTYKRVVYGEITRSAILAALAAPRDIDMAMVQAQEARRVLDRLIGYLVSPALSNQAGKSLSAGRVQSVAVRMVVDRERAIQNFKPETFHAVTLTLSDHQEVKAALLLKPWTEDGKHIWSESVARQFCGAIKATLVKQEQKPKQVPQRPPLTTVEAQSVGGKVFGLSATEVMKAAQALFEKGHITYHRTDNPNLSDEGFEKIKDYLAGEGLPHINVRPTFKAKGDAQGAHEAIRPTDIAVAEAGSTPQERQVYSLIRERALLVAMPAGVDQVTTMVFQSDGRYQNLQGMAAPAHYVATGKVVSEPGWRQHAKIEKITTTDVILPSLASGKAYEGVVKSEAKKTQPPGRFTEHQLVKALESAGIGRPATYASIIENIKRRQYIIPEPGAKKAKSPNLLPGDMGYYVVDALSGMSFMGYKYTKEVESSLDRIAAGQMGYVNIVRPVLKQIQSDIDNHLTGASLISTVPCPGCGNPVTQRHKKKKPSSKFWVHQDDSHAEGCSKFLPDTDGKPSKPVPPSACPNCSKPLLRREGKHGPYWRHEKDDDAVVCGHRSLTDKGGKPELKVAPVTTACLACGGTIKRLFSSKRKSFFWLHENENPSCGSKFIEDKDGVPACPQTA